jgi:uncharacterized protein HI_0866
VNQYILNQTNQEFKLGFNLRLDALKFTKEQIEKNLTEAKTVQIENLTNALDIAKKKQELKISQEEIIIFLYQNIC